MTLSSTTSTFTPGAVNASTRSSSDWDTSGASAMVRRSTIFWGMVMVTAVP